MWVRITDTHSFEHLINLRQGVHTSLIGTELVFYTIGNDDCHSVEVKRRYLDSVMDVLMAAINKQPQPGNEVLDLRYLSKG